MATLNLLAPVSVSDPGTDRPIGPGPMESPPAKRGAPPKATKGGRKRKLAKENEEEAALLISIGGMFSLLLCVRFSHFFLSLLDAKPSAEAAPETSPTKQQAGILFLFNLFLYLYLIYFFICIYYFNRSRPHQPVRGQQDGRGQCQRGRRVFQRR